MRNKIAEYKNKFVNAAEAWIKSKEAENKDQSVFLRRFRAASLKIPS